MLQEVAEYALPLAAQPDTFRFALKFSVAGDDGSVTVPYETVLPMKSTAFLL